jgi:hypothetical protein
MEKPTKPAERARQNLSQAAKSNQVVAQALLNSIKKADFLLYDQIHQ